MCAAQGPRAGDVPVTLQTVKTFIFITMVFWQMAVCYENIPADRNKGF